MKSFSGIISILIWSEKNKFCFNLQSFKILEQVQSDLLKSKCDYEYHSPSLFSNFLEGKVEICPPFFLKIPFFELLFVGKLNGVSLPEDELARNLHFYFFEYLQILCVKNKDIDGIITLVRISQITESSVINPKSLLLIPQFSAAIGALVLHNISLVLLILYFIII